MGAKILVIVWIAFGAYFLTVTPNIAVAQEKIPGLNDSDFQQALVDWLDGDTESLSVFAVLAKEGNSAATVLLARSSLFYLGRRDMKPFQPFIDALNMDAAPTSPAEVTRYLRQFLKTQTATVKALLDSTLHQEKWWILDESVDKTSMIATLMESGEIKIAVKFMSDEDLELYSQKYELPEFKKVRLWINAGLHQLKHIDSQVKLIEFANAWQKKRVAAYFVLPSLTYPLNQAHTYLSRPISELDMMVAVLVAGAERYAVLDTPLSKRGLHYRAALVPYTWTLKTADEFEPLRQVCDTLCPSDHLNCMRALNSMNEGAERMLRFSTPSEIIIPDQMFLKSQVAEDVFLRSNYYDRPSKLLSDDIYPEALAKGGGQEPASVESISVCAAEGVQFLYD